MLRIRGQRIEEMLGGGSAGESQQDDTSKGVRGEGGNSKRESGVVSGWGESYIRI